MSLTERAPRDANGWGDHTPEPPVALSRRRPRRTASTALLPDDAWRDDPIDDPTWAP